MSHYRTTTPLITLATTLLLPILFIGIANAAEPSKEGQAKTDQALEYYRCALKYDDKVKTSYDMRNKVFRVFHPSLLPGPGRSADSSLQEDAWVKKADDCRLKAAELGNADAEFELGRASYTPEGVEWLRRAANQGHLLAQVELGERLRKTDKSTSTTPENEESVAWLIKATREGNSVAQIRLQSMYEHGVWNPATEEEVDIVFRKGIDRDRTSVQYSLACLYREGVGVKQNYTNALALFKAVADHKWVDQVTNQDNAQYKLGVMYLNGEGVEKDTGIAADWFKKAAEHNHSIAAIELAKLYASGAGVERNDIIALAILDFVVDYEYSGSVWKEKAKAQRTPVRERLQQNDIASARRLANFMLNTDVMFAIEHPPRAEQSASPD